MAIEDRAEKAVRMLNKGARNAAVERDRYRAALARIRSEEGQVCETFEMCEHNSCQSSYSSWAIACAALDPEAR